MLRLYYVDKIETKLSKTEIEERLKDIVLEDHFFNIHVKGKKLSRAEFKENVVSFFYLPSLGKRDMLSPQMYMTILEKREGSACDLYYSRTWGSLCLFIYWTIFNGICVYVNVLRNNIFNFMCYVMVYILGIWIAHKHYNSICKKVINILKAQLDYKENIFKN